MEILIECEPMD